MRFNSPKGNKIVSYVLVEHGSLRLSASSFDKKPGRRDWPSPASVRANSRPMPLDAPVTTAHGPWRFCKLSTIHDAPEWGVTLVSPARIEHATSGLGNLRSIRLSYEDTHATQLFNPQWPKIKTKNRSAWLAPVFHINLVIAWF